MRIESVLIKNINSLAGTYEIDFTDSRYSEGLFAIVGPSGAGKTTILDAICLALYGKTPRIETISETQDEIMTKNCQDCAAETVFTSHGKRYKATFSHHRSKGEKPFRQVKREIWESVEGKWSIIASMIKDANEKIVEITGLTYSQFTRSIMLAQFRFAEFLKADSNERAAILEKISDMNIYRDISAAVYERAKREKAALNDIEARMQALKVLDEEQKKAYEDEAKGLSASIALHNKLRERFAACRLAADNIKKYRGELEKYNESEPMLAQRCAEQTKLFEQAAREESELRAALDELQKTLKTVRELDNHIAAQKKDLERLNAEIEANKEKVGAQKRAILSVFKKYVPGASGEEMRRLYEKEDIGGELRAGAKAELDAAVSAEKRVRAEIDAALQGKDEAYWHKRADALKIYIALAEAREAVKQKQHELAEQSKKHEGLKAALSGLEAQEKVIDEKLVYAKLEEKFGEERRKLEHGKPCPLCGAEEHPYAGKPFDSAFLKEAEKQKADISGRLREAQRELSACGISIAELEKAISEKTQQMRQCEQELGALGADVGSELTAVQAKSELAAAEKTAREYTSLLGKLSAAKDNVTRMTAKLGDVDKDLATVNASKRAIAEYEAEAVNKRKESEAAEKLLAQYSEKRIALFGEKDADLEEEKAKKLLEAAQRRKETCREQKESAERAVEQNKADIARTKELIRSESRVLDIAYADARLSLLEAQDMPISPDEGVKARFERFCETAARLGENAAECTDKFGEIIDLLSDLSSEETARQGAIRQMLSDNARNIKELGALKSSAEKQARVCEKWDRLNALIGSADGIKFSRMAQGFTFEVLLKYANNCLARMTDQYILVRDTSNASKPLELAIVDNYNAGTTRPVSNLSGGESFLVSLALALGMSEMSSGRTRIDSLFIDEGFASLDDDYLEAALQTLSSLGNREGKLVGVISHVAALKERIDTQIEVRKLSGGRSTLSGPGVKAAGE